MGWRHQKPEKLYADGIGYNLQLHLEINYFLTLCLMLRLDKKNFRCKNVGLIPETYMSALINESAHLMLSCCEPTFVLAMNVIKP